MTDPLTLLVYGVACWLIGRWCGRADARDEAFNAGWVAGHRAALGECVGRLRRVGCSGRN